MVLFGRFRLPLLIVSLCLLPASSPDEVAAGTGPGATGRAAATPATPVTAAASAARMADLYWSRIDRDAVREADVPAEVLRLALTAIQCGVIHGELAPPPTLTLIDYSRPSIEPRLWVFDLERGALLFSELVAHGMMTGENMAERFSDIPESRQSSLGLFVTGDTYLGRNGYSLRLDGLEPGFNGNARARAIVMHGAPYVHEEHAKRFGRLGRSWGCPALREAVARNVIDTIRGGGVVFSYYPDPAWLQQSHLLNCRDSAIVDGAPAGTEPRTTSPL